jgi:hypothetical protein
MVMESKYAGKKRVAWIKMFFFTLLLAVSPFESARAYVGPGVGITMLGAFWTVLGIILAAFGGLLVWPLRSFLRWKRGRSGRETEGKDGDASSPPR